MKFQRIGTGSPFGSLARMAAFSLLLLAAAPSAKAVDEDILPPADAELPAPRTTVPSVKTPNDSVLNEDESIPAPSLGEESLPEPSVDRGQEKAKNQVNKPPEDDEIFLPTPNVNDNVYYAPVGTPAPRVTSEDLDWRYMTTNRPLFSLYGGLGLKAYPNSLVKQERTTGYLLGASLRMFSLSQIFFLHATYRFGSYKLGDVGSLAGVLDNTQQWGGMLELSLSRRISFFLNFLRRQALVTTTATSLSQNPANTKDALLIGQEPSWYFGLGAQWDFYVIPHGSLGLHVEAEQDLYTVTLAMALEPAPKKKISLNYNSIEEE